MIDIRLQQLSYSSRLLLHSCPRKYQLQRLRAEAQNNDTDGTGGITLLYGSVVGLGLQLVLEGKDEDEIYLTLFKAWTLDLEQRDEKRNKNFYSALIAVQRFQAVVRAGILEGYELVTYQGKSACELGFCITFPDGFKYRGYVDAVLRHRQTGKVLVLEAKTTWQKTINPATYKHSAQAIGYSIVLDSIFNDLSSYDVCYFVYKTTVGEWEKLSFNKTYLQRAQWIQELIFDTQDIARYDDAGIFPMRGESCVAFGRECEYLQVCTLNTRYITSPLTPEAAQDVENEIKKYQIVITLDQLIDSQLSKSSPQ